MSKLTHIEADNFTAFAHLEQAFSPGINIVIGGNGTGKTQLLKLLYAACAITVGEDQEKSYALKLRNVFSPYEGRMGRLSRRQSVSVNGRGGGTVAGGFAGMIGRAVSGPCIILIIDRPQDRTAPASGMPGR